MNDCIFCKIISGTIPCDKVYEDETVFAFLDISPINKGHVLVVPKTHYRNLFDLPEVDLAACATALKPLALAVKEAVHADGINIGMNNEPAAGQVVWHAHFHIIPRFSHDGLHHWSGKKYDGGEGKEVAEKIAGLVKN